MHVWADGNRLQEQESSQIGIEQKINEQQRALTRQGWLEQRAQNELRKR
jgi:hypothetical protein